MSETKLTEQEKLEARHLKPVPRLPYHFMALLSKALYAKKCGVSFKYNVDLAPYRGKPYVVVANHASRLDHAFTAPAFYPDTMNFVVGYNEFFRSHLAGLMRTMQVVPKKNFTPQPYSIRQIIRIIKQGGRIMIMPEGMSSISGANQPVALGSGKLLKLLGVPVFCTKISGGYLTSTKYCLDERPGRVEVDVDLLFTPEQLRDMSAEELQHGLNAKLWHDDYKWNKTARVKFAGHGSMAKNIHQLLFWCPKCGAELQMEDSGDTIRCKSCGNSATFNEYCDLVPDNADCVIPDTPRVWFDMQRAHMRECVSREGYTLSEHVKLGVLPKYGYLKNQETSIVVGDGVLTLDRAGLHFDGTKNGEKYGFFVPIHQLPTYGMCTDVSRFYTFVDGEFTEFYPDGDTAEKWMMATEEMHRVTGGPWQDFTPEEIAARS